MRVAMLTTSYPRHEGDYRGVFVRNLVKALEAAGVQVEVVEPRGFDALKKGAGLIPNLRRSFLAKLEFPFYCLSFLARAVDSSARCDVMHANWSLSGVFAIAAGRLRRKRVLLTERSPLLINTRNRLLNLFTASVMKRSGAVVTISEDARKRLSEKFSGLEIRVIPNGVDDDLFSPDGRDHVRKELGVDPAVMNIISVGRLTPVKRLDTLLDAAELIAVNGCDFALRIVGGGELEEQLARRISGSPNLRGRVSLLGRKPQTEVARWIRASDALVLTSERESGGNVLLEALSAGLAVVTTAVGWGADLIEDGVNGLVVPIGNVAATADAIEHLAADPDTIAALGLRARETIAQRNLNWAGCARRYIAEYEALIPGGAS